MLTKGSIRIAGRVTSVTMEREFWDALRDIAADRNTTVSELLKEFVSHFEESPDGRRLASALRVYILEQYLPARRTKVQDHPGKRRHDTGHTYKGKKVIY
jgi:predicted DNA-binding ribbon-helix-helix protein